MTMYRRTAGAVLQPAVPSSMFSHLPVFPSAEEALVSDFETTIVAGVAFSPHAKSIASIASVFARRLSARLAFVHVGEEDAEARERLQSLLGAAGVTDEHELVLRSGNPADVLLEVATEKNAGLLIMGGMESEGMLERIFGSVARKVARRALCPVLLIPLDVRTSPSLDHVILGIRYGEDLDSVLQFTLELLRSAGKSRLHIVQESDFASRLAARYIDDEERAEFRKSQKSALTDMLSVHDFSGIDLQVAVLDESAEGVALVEYARKTDADLVITQAPSRSLTLRDRLITHPAEALLFMLPCGILLYRCGADAGEEE